MFDQTGGIKIKLSSAAQQPPPTAAPPLPGMSSVAPAAMVEPGTTRRIIRRAPTGVPVPTAAPVPIPVPRSATLAPLIATTEDIQEEEEQPIVTPDGIIPTSDQLRKFYENRVKKPHLYEFDARGNLVLKSENGRVEKVYTIPPYYPPTAEDLKQLDTARFEDVRAFEAQYDEAVEVLREAYQAYHTGTGTSLQVVLANNAVQLLDIKRSQRQFELQTVVIHKSVPLQSVMFKKEHGQLVLHNVGFVRRRAYSLQTEYARVGQERIPAPEEVVAETEGLEQTLAGGGIFDDTLDGGAARKRAFMTDVAKNKKIIAYANPSDNEYGFLSTFYPIEFTMDRVKYFTIEQAVAAEKARRFHYDEMRTEIMKTRAPRTMRTKANGIIPKSISETHGAASPRLDEWENKLRLEVLEGSTYQKFRQHSDLREQLLGTGDATIILADSAEKVDGIGLALENKDLLDSAKWRGENKYGKILMSVRKRLRNEQGGGSDTEIVAAYEDAGAVDEAVIGAGAYAEQTANAREGAIVGHFANAKRAHF
jgi:ribA/ribD-fused uncharacterized protein